MRILWITNIPSPYRVDFFNELGKSIDLTVLFERESASDRDSAWQDYKFENFTGVIMRGLSYGSDSAFCPGVIRELMQRRYDLVVVTDFSSPTGIAAIAYLKATRRPYFLESDGGFPGPAGLKAKVKRAIIEGASGYFSTSDVHDDYYLAYGARRDRLIRYSFTSVGSEQVLSSPPTPRQKADAKNALGFHGQHLVLFVGQFIQRKGIDVLLKAGAGLSGSADICIVGGDPTEEYETLVNDLELTNVTFAGFKSKRELGTYLTAADVLVLPTREDIWGLVINEALANGLPVVTTDRCVAGLELVQKHGCGRVIPVDDIEALREAIDEVLTDDNLREEMQLKALGVARAYTVENMAKRHVEVFESWRQGTSLADVAESCN